MDNRARAFVARSATFKSLLAALSVSLLVLGAAPVRPSAASGRTGTPPAASGARAATSQLTSAPAAVARAATAVSGTNILDENAILAQNGLQDPQWYKDNIPFLDSPDANINGVYYYRWDNVRRHLRDTVPGTGYVSTEFSQPVGYSGSPFNAIVAAAGHDIYEARWLRDQRYMDDFENYWLRGGGAGGNRQYTEWLSDAYYNRYLVNGDPTLLKRLLPDLIKLYDGWTGDHYTADVNGSGRGLYYTTPDADATEYTDSSYHSCDHYHGGAGYRPTINAYQYAAAVAISNTAALAGDSATAADFANRAATLKDNMQQLLWDPNKHFFMHLFTTNSCNAQGDNGMNWAGQRAVWREEMGFVPWAYNMPDARYSTAWQYLMDPNYFYAPYGPTTDERTHDFEAEDPATTIITDARVMSSTSASNGAYVGNISNADSAVAFTVTTPAAGTYPVVVYYANGGMTATQTLVVNGNAGSPVTVAYAPTFAYGQFTPSQAVTVNVSLNTGYNTLTFEKGAGAVDLDKVTANPYFDVEAIPPTDAQRRNDSYCCHWDGPSWPYETSQTLMGLANLLDNYPAQSYVTKDNYFTLLENYATTQHKNGAPYIAEAADADTGNWIYDAFNHSENYNHSTFNDLVISGLIGVRPRADDTFELKPLVPASWDHFVLENLPYHGHLMTVLYDKDGSHYSSFSHNAGLTIYQDGQSIYSSPTLGSDVRAAMATPNAPAPQTRLENYAANPVAADEVFLNQGISQPYPQPFASYTNSGSPGDSVWQAVDGRIYYDDIPNSRWTDYGSPNPTDYLGVDFGAPRPVNELKIYTYDDGGGVRAPAGYNVQYWNDTSWVDAPNQVMSPTVPAANAPNEVTFGQVITPKVRVVFTRRQVNGSYAGVGVTELQAWYPYSASGIYEAEQAQINHANVNYRGDSNASNDAFVGQIDYSDSYVRFTVNVPKTATYPVEVGYATGAISATHHVSVNGGAPFTVSYQKTPGGYGHFQTETVFMPLNAGTNTIQFSKGDQFAELDKITIQPDDLPVLQASYPFDEGSGITATDTSGNGTDGAITGGVSYSSPGQPNNGDPHALTFDGATGYVDVPKPVVDTLRGYSVAAWVNLANGAANSTFHSAVSIDGTNVSGFFLQYCGTCGKFAFSAVNGDDTGAPSVRAQAQAAPQTGTWYHLVGVYDATAHQLRLYVNGVLQDTQTYTGAFAASGHTIIAAGKFADPNNPGAYRGDYWPGQIDDVCLYQGILSDAQITQGTCVTPATPTETATATGMATATGTATATATGTATTSPVATGSVTAAPTGTPTTGPAATNTVTNTATTVAPTGTSTGTPPPAATSTNTTTSANTPTATATATAINTSTSTATATATAINTSTSTTTAVPPTSTTTAVPSTSTSTAVPPTATATTTPYNANNGPTTLYFAEGYTGRLATNGRADFAETLSLLNANPFTATAQIQYLIEGGAPVLVTRAIGPHSALRESVNADIGADRNAAAVVSSTSRLTAERLIRRTGPGGATLDADSSLGNPNLGKTFYFAEGYTGATFQEYLTLVNPGHTPANVTVAFAPQGASGPVTSTLTLTVPAQGRLTRNIRRDTLAIATKSLGLIVTSDQPLMAERVLYFGDGDGSAKYGATAKAGIQTVGNQVIFAYGSAGGTGRAQQPGDQSFVTVLNPGTSPLSATVVAQFYDASGQSLGATTLAVGPGRRETLNANQAVRNTASIYATILTSASPFVAEKPQYFGGSPNIGTHPGVAPSGAPAGVTSAAFPDLSLTDPTGQAQQQTVFLYNPTTAPIQVTGTYYSGNGSKSQVYTVAANHIVTVTVNADAAGLPAGALGATFTVTSSGAAGSFVATHIAATADGRGYTGNQAPSPPSSQ